MPIIDFHTHVFPDSLASRAMSELSEMGGIKPILDGTLSSLLRSMDNAGIEKSVVCSIATKPSQFEPILEWSKKIASDRIIPFPSVHPGDPEVAERIDIISKEGFKGIKLHPYYQDFYLNDEKLFPVYEKMLEHDLILVPHTGFDIAFPRERRADAKKIAEVIERFPGLTVVATHLGGWNDWDHVAEQLSGKPVYMEISFSNGFLSDERIRNLCRLQGKDYILYGTDSPWTSQKETLDAFLALGFDDDFNERVLYKNGLKLLGLDY